MSDKCPNHVRRRRGCPICERISAALAESSFAATPCSPVAGILYDATAGNNDCNGKIAVTTANDPMPDLKEVLHADDVAAATIPDSSKA